ASLWSACDTIHYRALFVVNRTVIFFLTTPGPPRSTLFPYTTLFRSRRQRRQRQGARLGEAARVSLRAACGNAGGKRRRRRTSQTDRKSTRLNSSHGSISYAVFCLKKKKK